MKDYTLNYEDSKTFVLNYTIEDDLITIQLASGEKEYIPYSERNEQKILAKMEDQVRNIGESLDKRKMRAKKAKRNIILGALAILMILFNGNLGTFSILLNGLLSMNVLALAFSSYVFIDDKSTLKDYEKNKFYLENKELIEETNFERNGNLLHKINEKTKTMIQGLPKEDININTMNKIKYWELKQILENIKRERKFGFDYFLPEKTLDAVEDTKDIKLLGETKIETAVEKMLKLERNLKK